MLWQYTRRDTKVLLLATLCTFSAYGFLVGQSWSAHVGALTLTANSVGVFAGVEENRVNTLLAELNEREEVLVEREAQVVERAAAQQNDPILLVVTLLGGALLGLILLNFYLDSKRRMKLA